EPAPNHGIGVWVVNAPGAVIGGPSFESGGNLISSNEQMGILLNGPHTTGARIAGNHIFGNEEGIAIGGSENVGGAAHNNIVSGNVIALNRSHGVSITLGASDNKVENNYIGTNADDENLGNAGAGVFIDSAPGNMIGGSFLDTGNVIEFNTEAGVRIQGTDSVGSEVRGNYISDNGDTGVYLSDGPGLTIIDSNTIAKNKVGGVIIEDGGLPTTLTNNFIGTDEEGIEALPNEGSGIYIENTKETVIGGPSFEDEGNIISGNKLAG